MRLHSGIDKLARRVLVAVVVLTLSLVPDRMSVQVASAQVLAETADGAPIVVPPGERAGLHVWNAGERDQSCLRWTDGCVTCSRDRGCNNIGPACQPTAEIRCLERKAGDDKTNDPRDAR